MNEVILRNDALTVEISNQGAEIQRILDANGIDRLWDGDPAFWKGKAPVLFPVAGALRENTYYLDGKPYIMDRHGFARGLTFTPEAISDTSATFAIYGKNHPHAGFPFDYAFRIRYTLSGSSIKVEYITENLGDETFWYGVGAHEAYACPEGIEAYEIAFDAPEQLMRGVLDSGYLTHETEPVPLTDGALPLHVGLFSNDTLVFAGHNSRGVTLRSKLHSRTVRVDFADFDYLLIWTIPGAKYICIEPWSNLPDYVDSAQDVAQKPGMTKLVPKAEKIHTHTITFG